jgi:hypothetical protein
VAAKTDNTTTAKKSDVGSTRFMLSLMTCITWGVMEKRMVDVGY